MKRFLSILLLALASAAHAQHISPCVDAIELVPASNGTSSMVYRFWFGYRSTFSAPVSLTPHLRGATANSTAPSTFVPGRHYAAFWVEGETVVWRVGGSVATASLGFHAAHPREFLDEERPFAQGGIVAFDFRTVNEGGANKYVFKWWRRNPVTGLIPNGLAWQDGGDWQTNPASGTVTYTLVLTDADRDAALTRLELSSTEENNRRALINEALRRVDTLTTTP
jgi:hypothetical protein